VSAVSRRASVVALLELEPRERDQTGDPERAPYFYGARGTVVTHPRTARETVIRRLGSSRLRDLLAYGRSG